MNELEPLVRLRLASDQLRLTDQARVVLDDWLESLPRALGPQLDLGLATSVLVDRGMWRASGPTDSMMAPMASFFEGVGVDGERTARLTDFGRRVDPDHLGYWLQARGDAIDAGWHVPRAVPLADAIAETPPSQAAQDLVAWCDDEEVDQVVGFERSLGPADYAGFWIDLPGRTPTQQAAAANDLMDDLDLGALPAGLDVIIASHEESTLLAHVWLIDGGVARFGVAALDPAAATLLALSMLIEVDNDDELALVQASLDADAPAYVMASLGAGRLDVEVAWEL